MPPEAGLRELQDFKGRIKSPARGETVAPRSLRVSGWALSPTTPVAAVDVQVDGRTVGRARLGVPRPGVARRLAHPAAAVCGFEYLLAAAHLQGRGSITLGAVAHLGDGSRRRLVPATVQIQPVIDRDAPSRSASRRPLRGSTPVTTPGPRIRVLAFTHQLDHGGAQRYLLDLLRLLGETRGVRSEVVSPCDGPLRSRLEAAGVGVHLFGEYRLQSANGYEEMLAGLGEWAVPRAFDLILGNTLMAFPGIDLADRLGIPAVWAIHESLEVPRWTPEDHTWPTAGDWARRRLVHALRSADALVFAARATRSQYECWAAPGRALVLPYGIDLEAIDRYRRAASRRGVRRDLGIPPEATVLLCLGKLEPRKAQACIAEAFSAVADRHPRAHVYLVGDDGTTYGQAVRDYVERAGLAGRIHIVPVTDDPYAWHVAADALVCASDIESLPISVLEAMAFETPVLATRIFGLPEVIQDGETGYLCEPRDLQALAAGLQRLLRAAVPEQTPVTRTAAIQVHAGHDALEYASRVGRLLTTVLQERSGAPFEVLVQDRSPGAAERRG